MSRTLMRPVILKITGGLVSGVFAKGYEGEPEFIVESAKAGADVIHTYIPDGKPVLGLTLADAKSI